MERGLEKRLQRQAEADARQHAHVLRQHERAVRRRERRLDRARRAIPVQSAVALSTLALGIPFDDWLWFITAGSSVLVVRAASRLVKPPPAPALPAAATTPLAPPPPRSSIAWPAVLRLEAVREELRRLVPLVGPAGREAATEAWEAAGEADAALRWQAARLAAVEPHRGPDADLVHRLFDGVSCQERLVAAMADLVAASDPLAPVGDRLSSGRLQDATDRLHGLADGLRALR